MARHAKYPLSLTLAAGINMLLGLALGLTNPLAGIAVIVTSAMLALLDYRDKRELRQTLLAELAVTLLTVASLIMG